MDRVKLVATFESLLGGDRVTPIERVEPVLGAAIAKALTPNCTPAVVVYPQTQEELAAAMACAYQNRWRVLPCGSGSKLGWGGLGQADVVISVAGLNRILDHAAGDLTVTLEAGVPLLQLQQQLSEADQFLPLDPAHPHRATLGGLIATADTGSFRQRYGGVRDLLIGISFVRYDGQIAKAGGRVVKNVAGYDLMKLMTGSYGTLGILSQLTLRTYPCADTSQTVIISGEPEPLERLLKAVRRSPLTPVALDVMTAALAEAETYPLALAARFQSIAAGVREQVDRLLEMVQAEFLSGQILQDDEDARFWRRSTEAFWRDEVGGAIAKVGVPFDQTVPWLASLAPGIQARLHGRGVGFVRFAPEVDLAQLDQTRSSLPQGAYLTVLSASTELKTSGDPWGYQGDAFSLMQALKRQFDPESLLSPGRFVGGL